MFEICESKKKKKMDDSQEMLNSYARSSDGDDGGDANRRSVRINCNVACGRDYDGI